MSTVSSDASSDPHSQPEGMQELFAADKVNPPLKELRIYSHSMFFYWWPVWVISFIAGFMTWTGGTRLDFVPPIVGENGQIQQVGNERSQIVVHPSRNLGIFFFVVLMIVIFFTNVALRGKASLIALLAVGFITVTFAYLGIWDDIIAVLPFMDMHLNAGFYFFFGSIILGLWTFSTFIYDRSNYWVVRPGQMTLATIVGDGEKSYDTRGMVFEKQFEDVVRHWVLGLGSGDLKIITTGARKEEIYMQNVLFVDTKVRAIQKLIATKPDDAASA